MSAAKKGKVNKKSELAERIGALQKEMGLGQPGQLEAFADRIGVARPRVSEWLSAKSHREPTPEAYLNLGMEAKDAELRRWFWDQSGFDVDRLLLAAAEELKAPPSEIVAPYLRNLPAHAQVYVVPEGTAGPFPPGSACIIEPVEEKDRQKPQPFWGQPVLLEFFEPSPMGWLHWPTGLFLGRLSLTQDQARPVSFGGISSHYSRLGYYATVGPLNPAEPPWSVIIGSFAEPQPPIEPQPGSPRERAHQERQSTWRKREELYAPLRARGVIQMTAKLEAADRALGDAESRVREAEAVELLQAEERARVRAPDEIRLFHGVRIVGRVIAWFAAPKGEK